MRRTVTIIIIVLVIMALFLIISNNYDLTKKQATNDFLKTYSGWVVKVAENSVNIVGNAIRMDWAPK